MDGSMRIAKIEHIAGIAEMVLSWINMGGYITLFLLGLLLSLLIVDTNFDITSVIAC